MLATRKSIASDFFSNASGFEIVTRFVSVQLFRISVLACAIAILYKHITGMIYIIIIDMQFFQVVLYVLNICN